MFKHVKTLVQFTISYITSFLHLNTISDIKFLEHNNKKFFYASSLQVKALGSNYCLQEHVKNAFLYIKVELLSQTLRNYRYFLDLRQKMYNAIILQAKISTNARRKGY